jgi:hypothetical protein
MLLHRPVSKLRHLLERFGAVEHRLGEVQGALDELRGVLADRHEALRLAEDAARARDLELRDSVHLAARRAGLTRPRTRVLFLVHQIDAWDGYHELQRAMRETDDFEPIVASIPRHFHGADGYAHEDAVHRGLLARGVPHLRLPAHGQDEALRLIKAIDPDLIFRQSQWDADIPDDLATDRLTFARLCLVPYETMNLVQNVPGPDGVNSAVDLPLHRAAWAVFCTNELMLEAARRDGARGGQQFRVTGHPKADRLRQAVPAWPIEGGGRAPRRRVVWSAHHSIAPGWSEFGAFPAMVEDMLAWAREDSDTDFVFMPHPALLPFTRSADSPVPAAEVEAWLREWTSLPNTALFTDGDYAPLLAASDLLITDGLSMLVEYQLLQKPLVFVERAGHRPFTEIGEIVHTGTHPVSSAREARFVASRFLDGEPDPLRGQQERNVARLFGTGPSVERILTTLREMLAAERGDQIGAELDGWGRSGHLPEFNSR